MADSTVVVEATITVGGTAFRALRYQLHEALSEVSLLHGEIMQDDADAPDPAELIGAPLELTLERSDGSQRRSFVGKVIEAERAPSQDDVRTVHLVAAPLLWQLGKRADCRTFQQKSVVDVAKAVLEGGGVPAGQQDWQTSGSYPARDYVVQYRETDLEFLLRLFSEEGIYFAIHFKDGKDIVVFGDDPTGFADIEGTAALPYVPEMGFQQALDRILHVSQRLRVKSDKVFTRDYNPEKPRLKLEATAESSDPGNHALEVYQYPGRFADPEEGKRLAGVLLDSIQAERNVATGETGVLTMAPGLRFSIEEHPYEPLNQEYLITGVRITWSMPRLGQAGGLGGKTATPKYACEFTAVPTATTKYRPPRRARERVIPGAQTAMTTGPSGQEIHTNEHGEVKVLFHWDRLGKNDDTSSRWMRTSQVPTGGSMLLPRVGWEVNVRHLEGDADRPLVMGRMYNAVTPPPYALPANAARSSLQTATTPGGGSTNELRMGDSKGNEEMFFNASKDMSIDVKNNTTESVGNDSAHKVGSNHTKNVTNSVNASVGSNQKVSVGGNQTVHVETFMVDQVGGNHSLTVGGNRDMKVGGDHKREVGGNSSLTVGGNQYDLVVGSVTDETLAAMSHNVGAAHVEITAANRSVMVGGAYAENTGAAKVIAVKGGRSVQVGKVMNQKVAGAIINSANGDRVDAADGTYTEIAAGAGLVKADNVVIEADTVLSLVMGASTLTLLPAVVAIAGVSVKMDGDVNDMGLLVIDN